MIDLKKFPKSIKYYMCVCGTCMTFSDNLVYRIRDNKLQYFCRNSWHGVMGEGNNLVLVPLIHPANYLLSHKVLWVIEECYQDEIYPTHNVSMTREDARIEIKQMRSDRPQEKFRLRPYVLEKGN
jgi:hypothetical protein